MSKNEQIIKMKEGIKKAALRLAVTIQSEFRFGWNQKSIGCVVLTSTKENYWLQVINRPKTQSSTKLWDGVLTASNIKKVKKPELIHVIEWSDEILQWRGQLMTLITEPICSPTPELRTSLELTTSWFSSLSNSLSSLGKYRTERINTRQDLITRRIQERFGHFINPEIEGWTTVHGDIHWANLTSKKCWILDWESWGRGPVGLDQAFLLCFSLLQPVISTKIQSVFKDVLESPDGIRSQLFVCSELLRMIELYGDHPDLKPNLIKHTQKLLSKAPKK